MKWTHGQLPTRDGRKVPIGMRSTLNRYGQATMKEDEKANEENDEKEEQY